MKTNNDPFEPKDEKGKFSVYISKEVWAKFMAKCQVKNVKISHCLEKFMRVNLDE